MTQLPQFDDVLACCPVCGGGIDGSYLTDCRGIRIAKCGRCSFQFMNPQYTDHHLACYYARYAASEDSDLWREAFAYGHGLHLATIEKYVKPGSMLDIGCGNGHLLEAAMRRGWSVCGYDVDIGTTSALARRLDIDVKCGDFLSCEFAHGFDLVTMHQVLEHVKDPNGYLQRIRAILNDDGHLFVAVPNIMSLSNRLKRALEVCGLRRKNIGKYYDSVHHLSYFEPRTLVRLLTRHGFEILCRRNCYDTRPSRHRLKRFVTRHIADHLFDKASFFVVARIARSRKRAIPGRGADGRGGSGASG